MCQKIYKYIDLTVYLSPVYSWLLKTTVGFKKESTHQLCHVLHTSIFDSLTDCPWPTIIFVYSETEH